MIEAKELQVQTLNLLANTALNLELEYPRLQAAVNTAPPQTAALLRGTITHPEFGQMSRKFQVETARFLTKPVSDEPRKTPNPELLPVITREGRFVTGLESRVNGDLVEQMGRRLIEQQTEPSVTLLFGEPATSPYESSAVRSFCRKKGRRRSVVDGLGFTIDHEHGVAFLDRAYEFSAVLNIGVLKSKSRQKDDYLAGLIVRNLFADKDPEWLTNLVRAFKEFVPDLPDRLAFSQKRYQPTFVFLSGHHNEQYIDPSLISELPLNLDDFLVIADAFVRDNIDKVVPEVSNSPWYEDHLRELGILPAAA